MENCAVCGISANQKCAGCNMKFYCSREHQKKDWKNHKNSCKCFEIATNEILGRYMVAKRDIKQGEIIIREMPSVVGPKMMSQPVCLGCLKTIGPPQTGDFYRCSKCTWPMCGKICENSPSHVVECEAMSEKKFVSSIRYNGKMKAEVAYCVIVPLRFILEKKKNPVNYQSLLKLVSHLDQRIHTKLYQALCVNLVPFIRDFLKLTDFSETEILNIAGILDTNCFDILVPSSRIRARGIYPLTAMMAHDCVPNTKHFVDGKLEMKVIACVPIKKGEMILTIYTHPLRTTMERQRQLKEAKCFDCVCSRCKDPTEMRTFGSGLKCMKCEFGIVVPMEPLKQFCEWKCENCGEKLAAEMAVSQLNDARSKLETMNKGSVDGCEEFLRTFESILPPMSVFMTDVKYALSLLYGNVSGYLYEEMPLKQVERKLSLCEELDKTLQFFEPGGSNSVLNTKFELSAAKIAKFRHKCASNLFKDEKYVKKLVREELDKAKKAFDLLLESSECKVLLENRMKRLLQQSFT